MTKRVRINPAWPPEDFPFGHRAPGPRARPEPDAGRAAADRGHPRGGHSPVRLSQDGRGAGRRGRCPTTATWCASSTATACTSASPSGTGGRRSVSGSCRAETPPGPEFWSRRIDEAVALRTTVLGLDRETNAYRVIHAEGDGLSGLIVDRFEDVLSVEVFSLGMYQRIGPILSLCAPAGDGPLSRRRR